MGDIPLLGRHNVANVLAAVAAADAWGVSAAAMRAAVRAFPGVEHRLERVRVLHGVSFYNDSIATTPTGTLAALAAIRQPIWLIAGGYDKGLPFQTLGETIVQRVKGVFLIGTTAPQLATSGASTSETLSPTPPVECLSTDGRSRPPELEPEAEPEPEAAPVRSSRSPEAIISPVQALSSARSRPLK